MVSEPQIRSVCLFFFYSLLDEGAAAVGARRTISRFQKAMLKTQDSKVLAAALLVKSIMGEYLKMAKSGLAGQPVVFQPEVWRVPQGVSLGPWMEFRRVSSEEEFLSVLLVKVLGFSESDAAIGMEVTPGTVRHRLSHGLRRLGALAGEGTRP